MEGLQGLKGLTPEDRANWEKQYSSKIQGFTPDQVERTYRNFKFKEKFGSRPDYENLKKYTPEQRDSLYNEELFPEMEQQDDSLADNISKAFQQGQQFEQEANKLNENYSKWPSQGRRALDEFDKIANEVSPYYKKYKNTEYLPFSDEEKYKLAAEYQAAKSAFGEQEANNILRRKMQNTASENQSTWEKYWNGFKGMGAQTAGALISTAGMIKGAIDYVGDERNENLDNAALDFLDHILDNSWTRYGSDVMQYGSLFDANIKEAKEAGLSNNQIIRTTAEEEGGILDNLLSVNTIPELINQQGFTIASMLTGTGLSTIADKTFKGARGLAIAANRAGALNNLEKVNKTLRTLQQAQQKVNAFVIPAAVGTVEGVTEGLNTKIQFLDDAKQMIAETQAKTVQEEFERRLQNPEELSRLGYNPQSEEDMNRLYKDIFDSYAPRYEEAVNKAEVNATKAGVYNMGLNSMINGALNMTLKAGLQTPSVQEALRRSRLGRLFSPTDFRVESGRVIPSYGKMQRVLNVLQEPAGEFTEEYLQSVSDAFARGGAEYSLQNFITNKYKGDGKAAVDESMADNFFAASRAAGDAALDKETLLSGIYGALASGMGTPTINNRRGPAVRTENESKLDYALRRSPVTYRNPIWQSIQEQREIGEERATSTKILTDWMQDPSNRAKYDGLVGTFNWAKSMDEASGKNDEFSYRNSELGKTINDVMMLQKLQGTDYYNSFMNDLVRAANAEEGSPEAQQLIEQFKNAPNNRDMNMDDAAVLETIRKNSNKLLDTMTSIDAEAESIDKMLGNAANDDTKQALIYGKLSVDSWRERATQLEDEISQVEISNPTAVASSGDTETANAILTYGSLDKAKEHKEKLGDKIDELKDAIEAIERRKRLTGQQEERALKAHRIALKTLKKEYDNLKIEDSTISYLFSESDILSMSPVDRATILNPDNKSKYSEKQQEIIDNVVRAGIATHTDFLDKVQDSGRINLAQTAYLSQYNAILSDPESFNAFSNRIKQEVADDNTRKKYEFLNGVQDYATFVRELDKAYQGASERERMVIRDIVGNNPNYTRYIEDNKTLDGMFDQIESSEKFKNLDDNDKVLTEIAMQFLTNKGVSPDGPGALDALQEMDSNGTSALMNYINDINGRLPDGQRVTPTSLGEIVQMYKDVMDEQAKNVNQVEQVNKPIEVTPTSPEASDPAPSITVGIFGTAANSLDESKAMMAEQNKYEMPEKTTEPAQAAPETNIVDKYRTNSNDEVANAADEVINAVNSSGEIYNDVRDMVTQIIDELGDSEYENSDLLKEALISNANQLLVQSETGGDNFDKASSLLKRAAAKIVAKPQPKPESKEERAKTPDTVNEERRNNALITTADVEKHPQSTVGQAYANYKIGEFLRKGTITPKTKIMFVADPAIIAGVKQEMGEVYNESDHLPIMAVVEDSNGPITIGDKKYQPIGFMPRNSANTQGAARMSPIRTLALAQQDGQLIKDGDNVVTTNGYVRANPPEHTKADTPNTPIHQIMRNDMDAYTREAMDGDKLPIAERRAIYSKAKDGILSNIRRIAKDGERIHLSYVTSNMKGGETEFELYVTNPQNSHSRTGRPMLEVLNAGTPEEVISANSRMNRYTKVLEKFFKGAPFSEDIRFKREGDQLVAVGEGAAKLTTLAENLGKKLNNFITVPKGYEYRLTPTENMLGENRMYQLSLTNGTNVINLAEVTNGTMTDATKAQVLNNLMLDGGSFRTEGSQPFAKWQVNYNDFNAKEGESDEAKKARMDNISNIFDDNILEASRTSFKYSIRGVDINSPFKQEGVAPTNPSPVVANAVNATQGKPINTPVITATDQVKVGDAIVDSESGAVLKGEVKPVNPIAERTTAIVNKIVNDSKDMTLDDNGYVDKEGRRYARVTSIIQADENAGERFDPASPWIVPSTNIGTAVDEFVRDFFAGEFSDENGNLISDYMYDYPNATQAQWKAFANQLNGLKAFIDSKGLTVIPRDVTVTGTVEVTDSQGQKHEILVAGTLDLLAYDELGNFHIFDMKTNRSGISDEKRAKYSKQVSMYKKFLEDKYGVKVASLNIIPIGVDYAAPMGFRDGKVKYEISEGNQLLANGQEFKDAKPTLEQVGSVPDTGVNIQYDKLTDREKQMITDMLPADVKPEKVEVPDAEAPVNKNLGLKMGKVKNRFAKPAKKGAIVVPSSNNWESISDEVRQAAIQLGYTKETWNDMTEEEKKHQKECLE